MKFPILAVVFFAINLADASVPIGRLCYEINPPSPQDNGIEVLWVTETFSGSGVFNGTGYHQDLAANRTPIHSTSVRSKNGTFNRFVYGSLGKVKEEIDYIYLDDVEAMSDMPSHSDVFFSHSVLSLDANGALQGTFRADDYYQSNQIYTNSGINVPPGIIREIACP